MNVHIAKYLITQTKLALEAEEKNKGSLILNVCITI